MQHDSTGGQKLCECGCGLPAPIAKKTATRWGHVKGEPVRFIHGHMFKTAAFDAYRSAPRSSEYRANISAAKSGKPGHSHTPESRAKIGLGNLEHGHKRGPYASPTYRSWIAAKTRCSNPNRDDWQDYGGRGITMCPQWAGSFKVFLADMGERPEGTSLDRIDTNGNYEPGNCRWATPLEQRHNRRK